MLCTLPGLGAPGGRCCLTPVHVLWLRLALCLSGVPRCPALVRSLSSGLVTLGTPVRFQVAVVPSPTEGLRPLGMGIWMQVQIRTKSLEFEFTLN